MIPKKIHYCWFGMGEKDYISKACMKTWKKYVKDYEIIEWNEGNVDLSTMPQYVQEAYKMKKYAFVSDYVRLLKMYEYGGIYLDTDMELCGTFSDYLCNHKGVLCYFVNMPMTAFFAFEDKDPIIKALLDQYEQRRFIKDDGSIDDTPIDYPFFEAFEKIGLTKGNQYCEFGSGYVCYPNEIFCGIDTKAWKVQYSNDTVMVHHLAGSWMGGKQKKIKKILKKILVKCLGIHTVKKLFP